MSISRYTFSSPLLKYDCPSQTPSSAAWKSLDLAPEINGGEGSSGTKIEVKGTSGLGCTVSLEGWKGSEAWVTGWLNPNASTWCCSIDSQDFTCHSQKGGGDSGWRSAMLCSYGGLDSEQEHTITIMNSPGGDSRLLIDSAASNGKSPDEVKTVDFASLASVAKPASINLSDYYKTTSTSSSSSSTTSSSSPTPDPTDSPATTSSSVSSEPNTDGASTNSTGLFLVAALGFLALVVICIISFFCFRTTPKPGRVSVGRSEPKQKTVRKHKKIRRKLLEKLDENDYEKDVREDSAYGTSESDHSTGTSGEESEEDKDRSRHRRPRHEKRRNGKHADYDDDPHYLRNRDEKADYYD